MLTSIFGESWMRTLLPALVKGKGVGSVFLLLKSANPKGKRLENDRLGVGRGRVK